MFLRHCSIVCLLSDDRQRVELHATYGNGEDQLVHFESRFHVLIESPVVDPFWLVLTLFFMLANTICLGFLQQTSGWFCQ